MTVEEPGELGYNGFPISLFYLSQIQTENISDPNITILFKNFTKKNAVTKEKRLAEFLKLLKEAAFDVSDYYILVCWLQLYPRVAIDSLKPVRALAHQVQAAYLNALGGKEFSKYLKSSIPVWLLSLYDDKALSSAAYKDLLLSFQNDKERVDTKIWVIFHEQIVNYCHAVLVAESATSITDERSETVEELTLKYERAMTAAILMLVKLVSMSSDGDFAFSDPAMVQFLEILLLESFWDHLQSCSSPDTLNTNLFRSMLSLITVVFARKNNALTDFTLRLDSLRSIYKLVSKKFIKSVKLLSGATQNSSIVYSTIVIPLFTALTVLTSLTNVDKETKSSFKLKKNFWQLGGSKSYSRLKDYLKLGPCNSHPLYYTVLEGLFKALQAAEIESEEDFTFLEFSNKKDATNVISKILLPQFGTLQGRQSFSYKVAFLSFLRTLFDIFSPDTTTALSTKAFYTILDGLSVSRVSPDEQSTKEQCLQQLAAFSDEQELDFTKINTAIIESLTSKEATPFEDYTMKNTASNVCSSYIAVLSRISSEKADEFIGELIDAFAEVYEPSKLSEFFTVLMNSLKISCSPVVLEWAPALPGFITEDFVKPPLQFLRALLDAKADLDYKSLVEDYFSKVHLEAPTYLIELLSITGEHNVPSNSPEADEFLKELSLKPNRLLVEDKVVFRQIHDKEILTNLVETSMATEQLKRKLIANLVASKVSVDGEASPKFNELILFAVKNSSQETQEFLKLADPATVKASIFNYLTFDIATEDLSPLASFVHENNDLLPFDEIKNEVENALATVDLSALALANPLSQNIYMVKGNDKAELNDKILPISLFLHSLIKVGSNPSDELVHYFGLAQEYVQDYLYLANVDSEVEHAFDLLADFAHTYLSLLQASESSVLDVFGDNELGSKLGALAKSISGKAPYTSLQFYDARLIVNSLSSVFELMSLLAFDALPINYTRLANHPLKLVVLLCAATKFVAESSKFDRIRNFVFGEVLGVRSSEKILDAGITWLSIATNFVRLNPDEVPSTYSLIPNHKLAMFVMQLSGWLESDIAFENEFVPMRSLMSDFFSRLIPMMGSNLPDKTWELAVDLCLNNLSTAQVEYKRFDLKYFTMKLYVTITKNIDEDVYPSWKESKASVLEELLDLLLNKEMEDVSLRVNNQPVLLCNAQMEKIFKNTQISKTLLTENAAKFYDLFLSSKFVNLQRISVSFLQEYILETQQDFVVEYQLRKSNLGDDTSDETEARLPHMLVKEVSDPDFHLDEALEDGKYSEAVRYLWSWLLIFDYFKDTTYSMKADYINQLKTDDAVEKLLHTVFNCVNVADTSIVNKFVTKPLEKNAKATPSMTLLQTYKIFEGCVGELMEFEMQFLLVHLYYLSFQYLGSLVQHWFNDIRDLQLKQQVQSFSVRLVSPILISKMLDEVDQAKGKLTERDDNLTIKVSKVANEIKSVYLIDEQNMEMVVKIPDTFPLSNVTVEGPMRLGVKENQWKAWLLASQRVVSLTNGSIIDCVELFNKNVNLHFSGFEECAICYSILHQDHSLPSKVCSTCLNKFHAACLYKWFKSSGSSTCPLCRSPFKFNVARA